MYGLTEHRSVISMNYLETLVIEEKCSAIPHRASRAEKSVRGGQLSSQRTHPAFPAVDYFKRAPSTARVCVAA
jgi:hypothetical protein